MNQPLVRYFSDSIERFLCGGAVLICLLAGGFPAQGQDDESWREDPYTEGDRKDMDKAGIVAYAPLAFGDTPTTKDIETALGDVEVRWVETAHFKIGSTLPEYRIANDEKDRIAEELGRLRKRLSGVKKTTKVRDPWLRLHLFAQRAEELYADTQQRLGVTDDDFPADRESSGKGQEYMGEGPYLGQPGKFLLLLFEKRSGLGRYGSRFTTFSSDRSLRFTFPKSGSLLFGATAEKDGDEPKTDTELTCQIIFNLTHNLVNGFKYYTFDMPCWITEGWAHYNARQVDEEENNFTMVKEQGSDITKEWNWSPKVRGRVRNDYFATAEELLTITDWTKVKFSHHMMMWSRIEYLFSLKEEDRFGRFVSALKQRTRYATVETEDVLARQATLFAEIYEMDFEAFDKAWTTHVLRHYERD